MKMDGSTMMVFFAMLLLCLMISSPIDAYNLMDYGAKGDGVTDDTEAFLRAWQDLCKSDGTSSTLTIPSANTFLVGPINFQGPCNSPTLHFQLLGTIIAPENPNSWNGCATGAWLLFSNVNGLTVDGGGVIDGRGKLWWSKSSIDASLGKNESGCSQRPTALHFENCNGFILRDTKHRNSPRNHIEITKCNNSTISNVDIVAPADSPNTDGIDVSFSSKVRVEDSVIRTGDDCIALSNGTSEITIRGITCGPGHGISIGSLGQNGAYDIVEGVIVQNCNFTGTQNGVRIKTWQGGSGYVRDITFEQITLDNVDNPIIINQYYCPDKHNCDNKPLAVNVSDIKYNFIQGTSSCETAINFDCSNGVPCTGIILDQVKITRAEAGQSTSAYCNNARGTISSTIPSATCLLS